MFGGNDECKQWREWRATIHDTRYTITCMYIVHVHCTRTHTKATAQWCHSSFVIRKFECGKEKRMGENSCAHYGLTLICVVTVY